MLRVGNGRAAVLADARVKISVLLSDGVERRGRRSDVRTNWRWPAHHPGVSADLDDHARHRRDKPAASADRQDRFVADDVRMFVSLEARDPDLATVVHDLHDYGPSEVLFGMRYADIVTTDEDGRPTADMTRISELEPDTG